MRVDPHRSGCHTRITPLGGELDALDPDDLRALYAAAIADYWDETAFQATSQRNSATMPSSACPREPGTRDAGLPFQARLLRKSVVVRHHHKRRLRCCLLSDQLDLSWDRPVALLVLEISIQQQ